MRPTLGYFIQFLIGHGWFRRHPIKIDEYSSLCRFCTTAGTVRTDCAFECEARLKLIEIQGADGIEDAFVTHRVRTPSQPLTKQTTGTGRFGLGPVASL